MYIGVQVYSSQMRRFWVASLKNRVAIPQSRRREMKRASFTGWRALFVRRSPRWEFFSVSLHRAFRVIEHYIKWPVPSTGPHLELRVAKSKFRAPMRFVIDKNLDQERLSLSFLAVPTTNVVDDLEF